MVKVLPERVWDTIFFLLCIAGCSFQLINIAMSYFSYGTVTRNRYHEPRMIHYPELHYCFLYLQDGLDWPAVEEKYGKLFPWSNLTHMQRWQDVLTIEDILLFTPTAEINECSFRHHTGNKIIHMKKDECNKFFRIRKYTVQQYICYHLVAREQISVTFRSIEASIQYERMIYEISFVGKLSNSSKIRPTIVSHGKVEYSRSYAPGFHKRPEEALFVQISCQNFTNQYIGYPYDSFVCARDDEDHQSCVDSCVENTTIKYLDRLPFTSSYHQPLKKKFISVSLINNDTISQSVSEWYAECETRCPMYACRYSICFTSGHSEISLGKNIVKLGSSIQVDTPSYPDIHVEYVASLPFLELIIYMLSCLGTWFGLVIISCNPLKLIRKFYGICEDRITRRRMRRVDRTEIFIRRMHRRTRVVDPRIFPLQNWRDGLVIN